MQFNKFRKKRIETDVASLNVVIFHIHALEMPAVRFFKQTDEFRLLQVVWVVPNERKAICDIPNR